MKLGIAALVLLTACATQKVWVKDGATQRDFAMESGQCKAQAFSVPNAPVMQVAIVYNSCMQGKGWYLTDPSSAPPQARPQARDANSKGWAECMVNCSAILNPDPDGKCLAHCNSCFPVSGSPVNCR